MKDIHDDVEREDDDLTGMIHKYKEENELRRKINELKKQKEQHKDIDRAKDSAFMDINETKNNGNGRIPDIRVDQDMEKTRVGFQDANDKTLLIKDRKQDETLDKQDTYTGLYEDGEQQASHTQYIDSLYEEEDLRKEVHNKKKTGGDKGDATEKDARLNKIITGVIIGVLVLLLLVGIGFGVKTIFFNGTSSDKTHEVKKPKKTVKKPKPQASTPTKEPSIQDNSAKIKQLQTQRDTYQEQLDNVESDLQKANTDKTNAQASLDEISSLYKQVQDYYGQMMVLGGIPTPTTGDTDTNISTAQKNVTDKRDTACKSDPNDLPCKTAQGNVDAFTNLKIKYDAVNTPYQAENSKSGDYEKALQDANDRITTLTKQQGDYQHKIADLNTELNKYK